MIGSPRKGGVESSQALHDKLFQLVALSDGSDHIEYLCWEASHLTPHTSLLNSLTFRTHFIVLGATTFGTGGTGGPSASSVGGGGPLPLALGMSEMKG